MCDGEHLSSECPWIETDAAWDPAGEVGDADGESQYRVLLQTMAPLRELTRVCEKEVLVLETVDTDANQRSRLQRSRHLVRAIRHLKRRRFDEVATELAMAREALPEDARIALGTGYSAMVQGQLEEAAEAFSSSARWGTGNERLDAQLLAGRTLLWVNRLDDAKKHLEAVAEGGDPDRGAQAGYELARCVVMEIPNGPAR